MKDVFVHETATVETGDIGSGTKIWHYAHVREGASIGKNCTIGQCAYIGKDVKVGNNCKIENKTSLFQGVTLEDDCFIGPHTTFTNDKRPRSKGDWKIVKTKVCNGVSIGANSTILCGITLHDNCMIGSGSVVTKDVPANALLYGNPAKIKGFVCGCGGTLEKARVAGSYVEMKCVKCSKIYKIPAGDYAKVAE